MVQAIYVPADDLTDPAPATTFAHLDATTVLSRSIAELGIYPAVDPLDSTSRMLSARILGQEHYDTARGVQRVLQVRHSTSMCITGTEQMSNGLPDASRLLLPCLPGAQVVCWAVSRFLDFLLHRNQHFKRVVCRTTRTCKISLPSWVWMSCLRRTS